MKKILITGASGLVGYEIAKTLMMNPEYEIFVTMRSHRNEKWKNVIQIDLQNVNIETIKIHFDCIVHCAAVIPNNFYDDKQVSIINRRIDDNIINYCLKNGCKLIYISTAAVYGYDDKVLLTEGMELRLNTYYKAEKRSSEIKIKDNCSSYCALRISSPYGARQKNMTVLKKFVDAIYFGEDIYYWGTGERTQNFIDVRDIAQAVLKCIECKENGVFNIASRYSISMKNLADLIIKLGRNIFNTTSGVYAKNEIDPQENVRVNIDINLAEKVIGWKPQIELDEGISYWMKVMKEGM